MSKEYAQLPLETQHAVDEVIDEAKRTRSRVSHPHKTGDVYAYPHPGGGIAWGVNGGEHGFNTNRDIRYD